MKNCVPEVLFFVFFSIQTFNQSRSYPARGGRGGWAAAEKFAGRNEGELRQL